MGRRGTAKRRSIAFALNCEALIETIEKTLLPKYFYLIFLHQGKKKQVRTQRLIEKKKTLKTVNRPKNKNVLNIH